MELTINGRMRQVDLPANMPVLWVLRDVLGMTGTKFGCGWRLCETRSDPQASQRHEAEGTLRMDVQSAREPP